MTMVDNVSFEVRAGEILGIAGVAGNGQSELANVLMGLPESCEGALELTGFGDLRRASSEQRRELRIASIPADRYGTALAGEKLNRVLTNDPGMGVIRHVDAGYDIAKEVARHKHVHVPMLDIE